MADKYDLANLNIDELPVITPTTSDYIPVYDASAGRFGKVAASADLAGVTATAAEINEVADVSARGGVRKIARVSFGAAELGGSETNTSFTFPANGAILLGAWIKVLDGESGTMDVGTQGTSNDPDGILDGIDLTNTGYVFPTRTHTTGLNADYLSATTFGALTHDIEIGADVATDIGYADPRGVFITGADPVSITSSGDLNSCSGYLFLDYIELDANA
jgi:hypothetical protein